MHALQGDAIHTNQPETPLPQMRRRSLRSLFQQAFRTAESELETVAGVHALLRSAEQRNARN